MLKKILKNLLFSLLPLFLFLTIAELSARLFWNSNNKNEVIREGIILEGINRNVIFEGIEYKVNSYGIRNRELVKKKDSQTFRIFALGDSFIWGDGLKNKDLITIKIENLLNKKVSDNINIEVVNTGIGGFNTQDEYNQLLRLFPVYTPNLVIQFFFTNDILATSNQNRILDKKVIYHMWLRKNSKFYSFLYYLIKGTINAEITFPKFLLPQDYFDLDDTKSGWVNFKKYTLRIKKFCEKNNLGYCFVLISTLTNLDENYPYIEINKKVTEFITNIDVPFLSYFDLFSKYEPTELWVSQENTHWNGKATTLAAKETTNFLIKKELIPYENNYSQVFLQ